MLRTKTLEGIPAISALSRSPETGWSAAVGMPISTLNTPLWRHIREALFVGFAMLAIALALAWLVARQVERAIRQFVGQSQALARGEPIVASALTVSRDCRIVGEVAF